jgi:hypothetical protein
MAETVTMSKDQLQELLLSVVAAAKAPNALEQRQLQTEEEKEKRRTALRAHISTEEENARSHKKNCTHTRYPGGHKKAGSPAPRGQGEWTTSGQLIGPADAQRANLCCLRCSYTWQWKPSAAEAEYLVAEGMLGMSPPPQERITFEG